MRKRSRALLATIGLLIWAFSLPGQVNAHSLYLQTQPGEPTPENTVIVANQTDARFSQDFSVLLKSLRLEWNIVDSATMPGSVKDKNLILLGRLDAAYTGKIIRSVLTADEIETIRGAGDGHVLLVKASPWAAGRSVYLCTGADLLLMRNAAVEAVRAIMASVPPASNWIRTRFDTPLDENARETVDRLRCAWDDAELPLANLRVDMAATPRRRISGKQAAEDVERLFYLLSHGYSGYAFFGQQGEWARAKARILEEVSSRSTWSSDGLARLLYEELGFITDCHLPIGGYQYAGHADFWYGTRLELTLGIEGYQVTVDGSRYDVVSVDSQDPGAFVLPALNAQRKPIYKLGMLSKTEPPPLHLIAARASEERQIEVTLRRVCLGLFPAQKAADHGRRWGRLVHQQRCMPPHGTTSWLRVPACQRSLPGVGRDQSIAGSKGSCGEGSLNPRWWGCHSGGSP